MGCAYSLFKVLEESEKWFWRDWPMDMKAVTLGPPHGLFSLRGTCPHCRDAAGFLLVGSSAGAGAALFSQACGLATETWGIMQCQSCLKLILGCAIKLPPNTDWVYQRHYPLGKPDDSVAGDIPPNIAADFREALRCRWVDAHNATVEMCRRAVQASCIEKSAPTDQTLVKQIEWLAAEGIITKPLKDMAHRVRLGGNLGAHPPEDPKDANAVVIGAEYADAVIEFTREFFQHVYVMPERLKKYTFAKTESHS